MLPSGTCDKRDTQASGTNSDTSYALLIYYIRIGSVIVNSLLPVSGADKK